MENQENLPRPGLVSLQHKSGTAESSIESMLAKLQTASLKLSTILDHKKTPEIITREFTRIFSALACSVSVWNEDENIFLLLDNYSIENWFHHVETDFPLKSSVFQERDVKQTTVNHLSSNSKEIEALKKLSVKTLLLVPIISKESVIGLVEIFDDRTRVYGEFELAAARLLAAHSATALKAMNLFYRLERSVKEQETLHDASLAISSSLDINGILTKIAENVCNLIDATSVYISKYDPDLKISVGFAEYYGPNANEKERVSDVGKTYHHPNDFLVVIKMLETGEPLVYSIDDMDLNELDRGYLEMYGGKSVLEIPLKGSGEFIGIIEIWDSQKIRVFSKEEIHICETIAQQAAIALENANLYQKAQDEIQVRKELEEKLRYDAVHDVLTDLPNRLLFYDRLEQAIFRHKRSSKSNFAVLYVDLDRFKYINDTFGHMTGDKVLIQAAKAIKQCVRVGDTVSRFGGDEFLILLNGDINSRSVKIITDRIQANLKALTFEMDTQVFLSASIGLVVSSMGLETADEYLKSADIAMYTAKKKGGARVEIFSATQELDSKKKVFIQSEILRASENDEFRIHFQPIIEFDTFKIIGFEALLRWKRKSGNLTPPSEFIPQLEGLGLISEVGNWVISESINHFQKWQSSNPEFSNLTLSVNVSINQLIHPKFVDEIKIILERAKFDPDRLIIEVTESILINDLALVTDTLTDLRKLGIKVHLDDFGTGFSSLSYLSDLPVNAIKIDRRFIEKIGPHFDHQGLLINILVMANDLELDVIAEGIETEEQLITLIGLNCRFGQGFLFSPGITPNAVEKFFDNCGDKFNDFKFY
jgi:diguanylate cyclase (GGDEF)-like protein